MLLRISQIRVPFTLICCRHGDQILMMRRFRPPFLDHWNFLGGKIERNEDPTVAAQRELLEEAGIPARAARIAFRGLALWPHETDRHCLQGMYLFSAALLRSPRRLTQTHLYEEGILSWWSLRDLRAGKAQPVLSNLDVLLTQFLKPSRTPSIAVMWKALDGQLRSRQRPMPKALRLTSDWPPGPAALPSRLVFGDEAAIGDAVLLDAR